MGTGHSSPCSTSFFSLSLLRTAENHNELLGFIKHKTHTHKLKREHNHNKTNSSYMAALFWMFRYDWNSALLAWDYLRENKNNNNKKKNYKRKDENDLVHHLFWLHCKELVQVQICILLLWAKSESPHKQQKMESFVELYVPIKDIVQRFEKYDTFLPKYENILMSVQYVKRLHSAAVNLA